MQTFTRRTLLGSAAALMAAPAVGFAAAAQMVVNKDPNCGCCTGWVKHIQAASFDVRVVEMADLAPLKSRLAIPRTLLSCHTAQIDGYVIEGHVPAPVIKRLLTERPAAIGLAVPGMPVGSPGMEVPAAPDDTYNVVLFGASGQRVYARYKGPRELT